MPTIAGSRPFKRLNNIETLNWIRRQNSTDYQARVPEASAANIEIVMDNLFNYRPIRNEFIGTLVNQIGLSRARSTTWANPLKNYKRENLPYGDTFEETFIGLAEAHVYDPDRDYMERILFGRETPETQTVFHKITRQEFYKITIDMNMLKRAFNSEYGISDFVTELMRVPATSDEWDEFLQMTSLFGEYYARDGYFIRNVPDVRNTSSDAADAKALTRQIRSDAETLRFVSRHYNAAGMPVAVSADDLILFVTPEAQAAIDVEALAASFNMDKADIPTRVEVIPAEHFNIPGMQAILTTRDFFVVMDQTYETSSQFNAVSLTENHFLHHHEVMSVSPFAPAILYSSIDASTVIPEDDSTVTDIGAITVYAEDMTTTVTSVTRGDIYQVTAEGVTDPEGGLNNKVKVSLTGAQSEFTRITQTGTLYVGHNERAESLTVTVTALDSDDVSKTATLNVTGDIWGYFPDAGEQDSDDSGDDESEDGGTEGDG